MVTCASLSGYTRRVLWRGDRSQALPFRTSTTTVKPGMVVMETTDHNRDIIPHEENNYNENALGVVLCNSDHDIDSTYADNTEVMVMPLHSDADLWVLLEQSAQTPDLGDMVTATHSATMDGYCIVETTAAATDLAPANTGWERVGRIIKTTSDPTTDTGYPALVRMI